MVRVEYKNDIAFIGGDCADFVCRCCYTKFGRKHQFWCERAALSVPSCRDCKYYKYRVGCLHPARKIDWRDPENEEA